MRKELAKLANIDMQAYEKKMLEEKGKIDGIPPEKLINSLWRAESIALQHFL